MKKKTAVPRIKGVEHVTWHGQHIATVIRSSHLPSRTTFVTPDAYYQQAGFVVYQKGRTIPRHIHLPLQRHLVGTPETLIVLRGKLEAELYSMDKKLLAKRILERGDVILLVAGGHCFRCLRNTVLMEIKQGPYTGLLEKEGF